MLLFIQENLESLYIVCLINELHHQIVPRIERCQLSLKIACSLQLPKYRIDKDISLHKQVAHHVGPMHKPNFLFKGGV